jgi:G3E family GTPase
MESRTPIMLITGSLGSGKTTLLKRILANTEYRLAVLMNEFGEIAVDSRIVQGENIEMIELLGGCVCCSMTGELEAAVREILEKIRPDFIIVEATGVAEADALAYEVEDNLPEVRLDSIVCIVDAYLSIKHPYVGYTARTHLETADIVLINKIDLVTTDEVEEVEAQVRKYNKSGVLFKTVGCDVEPRLLFGLDVEREPIRLNHHGEAEFQSFSYTSEGCMDEDRFRRLVSELPPSIYRAKGFVCLDGRGQLFNYVVGRADLEDFESDKVQLVFIGRNLEEDRESILSRLRECEV